MIWNRKHESFISKVLSSRLKPRTSNLCRIVHSYSRSEFSSHWLSGRLPYISWAIQKFSDLKVLGFQLIKVSSEADQSKFNAVISLFVQKCRRSKFSSHMCAKKPEKLKWSQIQFQILTSSFYVTKSISSMPPNTLASIIANFHYDKTTRVEIREIQLLQPFFMKCMPCNNVSSVVEF